MDNSQMDTFTFRNESNAYFQGNDVVATRERDGREIKLNGKDGYLAVNVKDRKHGYGFFTKDSMPEGLAEKAADLNRANKSRMEGHDYLEDWTDLLYQRAQETFWNDAKWLAEDAGFKGVFSEGRSGGWCCIEGMTADEARSLIIGTDFDYTDEEKAGDFKDEYEDRLERRSELLNLLIDIEDCIEGCHQLWYEDIAQEWAELQDEREACLIRGED